MTKASRRDLLKGAAVAGLGIQVTWVEDASNANLRLIIWESSTVEGTRITYAH